MERKQLQLVVYASLMAAFIAVGAYLQVPAESFCPVGRLAPRKPLGSHQCRDLSPGRSHRLTGIRRG